MTQANPNFPVQVWDGLTDRDGNLTNRVRTSLNVTTPPHGQDWQQLIAEMQQVQTFVLAITSSTIPSAIADETLSTGDLVRVKSNTRIEKADATNSGSVTGMALTSGVSGEVVQFATSGSVVNLAWTLNPGVVYFLGSAGQLSLTPPSTGWSIQLGQALAQQVFSLNIQQTIRL